MIDGQRGRGQAQCDGQGDRERDHGGAGVERGPERAEDDRGEELGQTRAVTSKARPLPRRCSGTAELASAIRTPSVAA